MLKLDKNLQNDNVSIKGVGYVSWIQNVVREFGPYPLWA